MNRVNHFELVEISLTQLWPKNLFDPGLTEPSQRSHLNPIRARSMRCCMARAIKTPSAWAQLALTWQRVARPNMPNPSPWRQMVGGICGVSLSPIVKFFSIMIYTKTWTHWYNYVKLLNFGSSGLTRIVEYYNVQLKQYMFFVFKEIQVVSKIVLFIV